MSVSIDRHRMGSGLGNLGPQYLHVTVTVTMAITDNIDTITDSDLRRRAVSILQGHDGDDPPTKLRLVAG